MEDMCKRSSKFSGIGLLLIGDLIRLETLLDRVLSMYYRGSIFRYFLFKLHGSYVFRIVIRFDNSSCVKDSR